MQNLEEIPQLKTSPELIKKLAAYSIKKHFKEGEVVVRENAYVKSIPIVTKGILKVLRTDPDGKEILIYYLTGGETCIMPFLGGMRTCQSIIKAEVEEDAEILFLPLEKGFLFFKEYPEWTNYIFELYHRRFEELLEVISEISFKRVDERLLSLLHKKQETIKTDTFFITHAELAGDMGTARVVISRLLKELERQGKVLLARNKITLL